MTATDRGERCLVSGRRPEGFRLFAGFVGNAEQRDIERWILDNFAWEERRHGPLPPCEQYPQDGPIPAWAVALGERMTAMGIFASSPDHVLLRRYDRGRGVRPHIDRVAYGPVVAGLTLVSSRMFHLTREGTRWRLEVLLLPGDLYVMTGAARHRWRHSIPDALEDEYRGAVFPRTDGFSVTWRYSPATVARRRWWSRVPRADQRAGDR
ncbi:MAG TPA: alpha-ketoglutarate-dependent dioxygenase AlkB [Candidatus Methylomirabilis sp.]|nr:alpha-ketoglutarate-dependent dioxygenase AlkB [Candidatus Methylomirabilis sp.]